MTETDKVNIKEGGEASPSGSRSESTAKGVPNRKPQSDHPPELDALKTKLKALWSSCNSNKFGSLSELNSELTSLFVKYEQPLEEYLDLLEVIIDNGWTGSFSCHVTRQFVNWVYAPETVKPEGGFKADKKVQMRALTVTSKASSKDIMELIFHVYNLSESQDLIFLLCGDLEEKNRYVQLCHWICLFKVEDKFQLKDYIYPLMLTRNFFEVFFYLKAHPDQVTDVVKFIDSLFYDQDKMTLLFLEHKMEPPKKFQLDNFSRNIEALLKKIIKHFKISSEITPNFNKKMTEHQIRFYVMNLRQNNMSEEAFKERVESFCQDDEDWQKVLVQNLLKNHQTQYLAEYYCNLYNLEIEHPKGVQRVELEEEFHSVEDLDRLIVFVDSVQLCNAVIDYIDSLIATDTCENGDIVIPVGIDTEWKSVCNANVISPPALLQIAFEKRIFLVDITVLHDKLDFWQLLNDKLLLNTKFLKLGFGLNDDQCKLDYYSHLSFINLGGRCSLDIRNEQDKYLYRKQEVKFPYETIKDESGNNGKSRRGLSKLVALCFSKPLDKREQLSDWERRPLRNAQLKYAALDAYALIQVYNVLKGMHKKANLKFDIKEEATKTKNRARNNSNYRRWPKTNRNFMRNKFRSNKKKVEVSTQAVVDSSEVCTQTDKN